MNILKRAATWTKATWNSTMSSMGFAGYSATDPKRKILSNGSRPSNATANQLLTASLSGLRAYCRHLERNNPTARAGVEGLVANVVGTGIALEPDTGDDAINAKLRLVWQEYIKDCAVNGQHDVYYLQCQAFREIVIAGEFLWRLVVLPERVDAGCLPIAVLPLEAEWLDDQVNTVGHPDAEGLVWVAGVGVDKYGRAVAYRIRNPETPGAQPETLKAKEILHDFERRRSLQARGEPWLAPVVETLQQERDLVDAELKAAVNTASIALVITSEAHDTLDTTEEGDSDDPAQSLRLGGVSRMYPGEKVEAFGHTRPSQQIALFRGMLRGDIAGALRLPQRFLDRDVGRANYSSMRCDMIDNEKLLAPVREWFGQATIGRLYQAALPYLALQAGIKLPRANYRLLPDGQPYVDPYKDAQAAALAIAAGLTTHEAEISKKGGDYLSVWKQVLKERNELKKLGIAFDLSGTNAPAPAPESQVGKEESSAEEEAVEDQTREAVPQNLNFNITVEGARPPVQTKQSYAIKRGKNGLVETVEPQ